MNETQELLDKIVLSTVRAIIVRDLDMDVPMATDHEIATLRSIACSDAAVFGTKLSAHRALTWLVGDMLIDISTSNGM